MDDRTPREVIQENLDHYTDIFAHKEPCDAPKHIFKFYTDLPWIMDDRTPRWVIQENLDHYTDNFAHREPRDAPKRILVYGQPGKWANEVKNLIVLFNSQEDTVERFSLDCRK